MQRRAIRLIYLMAAVCGISTISWAAQTAAPSKGPVAVRYTATSENVSGAGEAIKINLFSWSTDSDRDEMVAAWTLTATAAPAAEGRGGRGGRGARGGARGGRGGRGTAAAAPVVEDPDAVQDDDNPAFRFGRGARGRGDDAATAPATPQSSLTAKLKKTSPVGILWTSETVGYSINYAYRSPQSDGSERIILATDRRVGAWNNLWKPAGSATPNDYEFSVIELRVNSKGEGEGKGSFTGKLVVDNDAKSIALDGYSTLPVVFKGLKRQAAN
jgi:hypothetical protein